MLVLVAVAVLATPAAASGHAASVGSEPQPGVRLQESPNQLVLTFTEPLNRRLAAATLVTARSGERVPADAVATSSRRLVVRPTGELTRGAYRVRWHSVSTLDGHALEGSFSFGVRAAAVGGDDHGVVQSPLARNGWLRVTARVLLYVGLLLGAASVLIPVLLPSREPSWLAPAALERSAPDPAAAARRRERALRVDLLWLATAGAVAATLAEAADAAGGLSPALMGVFLFDAGPGLGRIVSVLLLALAAGTAPRHPRAAAAAVTMALGAVALSGHAASARPRLLAITNDWLHLIAGSIWVGGIGLLVLVWGPALRRGDPALRTAVTRDVLPGFGRVALPAAVLVGLSGLASLTLQLGALDELVDTAYGRILLAKMALVGVIALLSFVHVYRLRPRLLTPPPKPRLERRHWRLLRAEPVVGLAVVVAVGLLVAFPLPPRQMGAGEALAATAPCDPCPLPAPAPGEIAVADHAGSQLVAAWLRRRDARLIGTVRVLDLRGEPSRAPARVLGQAGQASCGRGCRRVSLPAADVLRVAVRDRGRRFVVALPARWRRGASRRARRLLMRAQRAMRALRSVRQVERVSSGLAGTAARSDYRLEAPDRMAFETSAGTRTVVVGDRQCLRAPGIPWRRRPYGSGVPFSTRSWFRWTPYARAVRLLGRRVRRGRRVSELALMDEATPVWFRLVVDERTGRVLRERMTGRGNFGSTRFSAFNRPLEISPPDA